MFLLCLKSGIPSILLLVISQLRRHFQFYGTHLHITPCVCFQWHEHECTLYGRMIDNRILLCVCVYNQRLFPTQQEQENCADREEISFVLDCLFPWASGIAEHRRRRTSDNGKSRKKNKKTEKKKKRLYTTESMSYPPMSHSSFPKHGKCYSKRIQSSLV